MCLVQKVVAWAAGALALAGAAGLGGGGSVMAQGEPTPGRSVRGGMLTIVGVYRFEVFFYATGVRVFAQDAQGAPLDASKLTGSATFYHPNSPEPWFIRTLRPAAVGPGQTSDSLDLAIRLRTVPTQGAKVAFDISGLPARAQSGAAFTVPVEFVETIAGRTAQKQTSRGGFWPSLYPESPGSSGGWYSPYPRTEPDRPAENGRFRSRAERVSPRALGWPGWTLYRDQNALPGSPRGSGIAPSYANPGMVGGSYLIGRPGGVLIVPK